MRDKLYTLGILTGAGVLLFVGRGLLQESAIFTFGLTFAGTMAAGILGIALYRVQLELRASRQELAMRRAEIKDSPSRSQSESKSRKSVRRWK